MVLQVANVEWPNSLANTQIIGLFEGSDCTYNLHVALQSLQLELAHLESCTWRGKTLRLFHFGDYEYLTKVYGLTGPNGRHCCLYCDISKQQMIIPPPPPHQRPPTQPRTLESMARSLLQFNERKLTKETLNVIQEPMFNIPIEQVCPPGLHMSLGIYLKHFNALEKECHKLDLQIAELLAKGGEEQSAYKDAFKQRMEKCKMEAKLEELSQDIPELTDQHNLLTFYYPECEPPAVIMQAVEEKTREKERLTHATSKIPEMPLGAGPITSLLDEVLQTIQVHRQAYHGRSFLGNHVHKCLKPENIDKLMTSIVEKVQELLPNSPTLHTQAPKMSSYRELFQHYGRCHNAFNSGKFLTNKDIDELEHHIKAYMIHFRESFPKETVPLKCISLKSIRFHGCDAGRRHLDSWENRVAKQCMQD